MLKRQKGKAQTKPYLDPRRRGPRPLRQPRRSRQGPLPVDTMTGEQFRFLEGIWALHPNMPPRLPRGDSAVLVRKDRDKDGYVLFVSGKDRLCDMPMPAPEVLLKLLKQIKEGPGDAL